jgi:hypothetical protein
VPAVGSDRQEKGRIRKVAQSTTHQRSGLARSPAGSGIFDADHENFHL